MSAAKTHYFLSNGPAWDLAHSIDEVPGMVAEFEEAGLDYEFCFELKKILIMVSASNTLDDSGMCQSATDEYDEKIAGKVKPLVKDMEWD